MDLTYSQWTVLIHSILGGIFCFVLMLQSKKDEYPSTIPVIFTIILCLIEIILIYNFPTFKISDKHNYYLMFKDLRGIDMTRNEIGWYIYMLAIKKILYTHESFFFLNAFIYVFCIYIFGRKLFTKEYAFYYCFTVFVSLGFWGYGTNTMRAGLALGFLLLAFGQVHNICTIFFCLVAVSFHTSMLLPIAAFFLAKRYNNPKFYIYIWCFCLMVSFLNVNPLNDFFVQQFGNFDSRVNTYLTSDLSSYYSNEGFRYDFVLYSLAPILYGFHHIYRRGFEDEFYNQMLSCYIIANAVWLLVIYMPFTDRVAYLSWFLIPYLILMPIYDDKMLHKQRNMAIAMASLMAVNCILMLRPIWQKYIYF